MPARRGRPGAGPRPGSPSHERRAGELPTPTATNVDSINGGYAGKLGAGVSPAALLDCLGTDFSAVDGGSDLRDVAADVVAVAQLDAVRRPRADLRAQYRRRAQASSCRRRRLELAGGPDHEPDSNRRRTPEDCPADGDLANCDVVACGELCEGDGECGTDGGLDNCGGGFDIYRKICVAQPSSVPTSSPSTTPTATPAPTTTPRPTSNPTLDHPLRLVGGSTEYEGRVEILHDGPPWGPRPSRRMADADVVDRQLFGPSFTGTNAANQVEMNMIRKYGLAPTTRRSCATRTTHGHGHARPNGDGLTRRAPGASIFANIEYWPLLRLGSGRGTARGDGTFRKGRAKEGALRWSDDNDQGRFVYPYADGRDHDGPCAAAADPGAWRPTRENLSTGGILGAGSTPRSTPTAWMAGTACVLVVYGASSDDMTTACAEDNDCTAPATCVLKPTGRDRAPHGARAMHTYWPFGYNRTTYDWTYGYCPLPAGSTDQCCCETDIDGRRVLRGLRDAVPNYVVVDDRDVRHE